MDKAWKEYETKMSKMREERRKREFSVNSTSTLLNVSSSNSTTALTNARSGTLPLSSCNDSLFDSSLQPRLKSRQSHIMGSIGSNLELSPPYPPDEELEKGKRFLQLHLSEVSVTMSGEFIVKNWLSNQVGIRRIVSVLDQTKWHWIQTWFHSSRPIGSIQSCPFKVRQVSICLLNRRSLLWRKALLLFW